MLRYSPWGKRLRLSAGYFLKRPVWCTWQVTYRCNFKCTICDYWKLRPDPSSEQTVGQIKRGSAELGKLGSMLISIGGGEPLLRKDLPRIVEAMATYHFPLVTTNGWLVTPDIARELWQAGLWGASVSIDYADPRKHDAQRRVKGAFERALRAVRFLVETRTQAYQRVNILAVLTNDNLDQMERLLEIAKDLGAWFMVQPYSTAKTGDGRRLAAAPVSERLLELRRRHRNFLSNPMFLEKFDRALNGGVPNCCAGKAFFNIDNYGNVSACVEDRRNPVGKIHDTPIGDLLARLSDRCDKWDCRRCWYNCRGEIEALHSLPTLLRT